MKSPNQPRRVIPVRDSKKVIPRVLPPMDRPVTPRDIRSIASAHSGNLLNVSISRCPDLPDAGESSLEPIISLFSTSSSADDVAFAITSFHEATQSIFDSRQLTSSDLNSYHQIYPFLVPIIDHVAGSLLVLIVRGLQNLVSVLNLVKVAKPKPPVSTPSSRKGPRIQKLEPLAPLKESATEPEKKDLPIEHFCQFLAKILYKMSGDKANDPYFTEPSLITQLISLTSDARKIETRTYAVAALKNASHASNFRSLLIADPTFADIIGLLNCPLKKPQFIIQVTGLLRNLIADSSNLDTIVGLGSHVHLIGLLSRFGETADVVFNAFRILTKISGRDNVRSEIIARFPPEELLALFLQLMNAHKTNHQIISRLSYVFSDFAAYEPVFLAVGTRVNSPLSIGLIDDLLHVEEIQADKEVAAMLVQVVANLSVDSNCAGVLREFRSISLLLTKSTFEATDRLGFNLLCAASNFTFHEKSWCPAELLRAIPVAFVSKHVPSIVEALRSLCNLALVPNSALIDSQIPDLLGILLKHVNPDIVLYALQTLANLVNHPRVRRKFRERGFVADVLALFASDEIEELELAAIAALIMNFGDITPEESAQFRTALDEFEINRTDPIVKAFLEFLQS
jgi:hypothetical protein